MYTRFTRLLLMFLLHQKFSSNFSDFFHFSNSSSKSHRLTLICVSTHVYIQILILGKSFQFLQFPSQTDMLYYCYL